MAANSTVKVSFLGDASDLVRASKQAGDAVGDTGKKASKFGAAVAAGAALAAAALVKFGKDSVDAFVESEQASARLDDALKRFPATNDKSRASFDRLNESLAKKTKFDDDATASGQAVLAQFKLTGTQIQQLTPLLQDYAAKTGKDIPDAANTLGKALLGKGKALAEVGIKFKDAGTVGANFDQIVGGLRKQVGGFAETEGKTAAGTAQILGNRFGEVQEKVGAKLTPALTALANKLLEVIGFVERNQAVIVPLVAVLGGLAAIIVTITSVAKAYTAVQTALNIVMAANPVGLIVVAVVALAAGLVLAYKKSETFRDVVNAAFRLVLNAASGLLGGFEAMLRALGKIPGFGWAKTAADSVAGARAAVDRLAQSLRDLPDKKTVVVEYQQVGSPTAVSYQERNAAPKKKRAAGGPVMGGQRYLVGENSPETFVPNQSGRIYNSRQTGQIPGGGSSYVLNLSGTLDASINERTIQETFRRMELLAGV